VLCGKTRTEPLTSSYRIFLYILVALFVTMFVSSNGKTGFLGLTLCGIYAVVKDAILLVRARLARVAEQHK
jgi:hypothetical protein